ncbi:WLM domain-containing protein [Colletotrichum sublineola]|uniref:Putative WLM domain-containing protein n=1 Tax=Colletotrichum sublineola TaxID=1173701 RepID=A0A066XDL7_COLSU|nr:WLM domain-containing protein [Colletotrichum sublineola]KDN65719.1 putative WLM domain-containing protein [Colletotrichum sublineola]
MAEPNAAEFDYDSSDEAITITLTHRNTPHTFRFPSDGTITHLSEDVEDALSIPPSNQKFIVPKLGLLKPPFKDPNMSLAALQDKKIMLMGVEAKEVASLQAASEFAAKRNAARSAARRQNRPFRRRDQGLAQADSTYTFLSVRPLAGLPHPERSLALLERLKEDPGIRAAMRKHKFSVGLLTEMEPLSNTQSSHEGTTRLLGLNRNGGEVIELRLRTDAHDGYRDYKTIRKTLCHELAHNVHSPHDRNFWDLCHQIEREVDAADWKHGGHTVGQQSSYYAPGEDEEEGFEDHGGWEGGDFVVGGDAANTKGLSRREILAKAAEERVKKMNMERRDGGKPDPGPSS